MLAHRGVPSKERLHTWYPPRRLDVDMVNNLLDSSSKPSIRSLTIYRTLLYGRGTYQRFEVVRF